MIKIISTKKPPPVQIDETTDDELSFFVNRKSFTGEILGFQVFIIEYAWNAFINHGIQVYKETGHEAQGIFIGKYCKDDFGEFAVATEYKEGYGESSRAYVGMTNECLIKISDECRSKNLLMLIWVHTHPDFGVFYSGTDMNCIKNNFFMPYHSGIVVDIIRKETKGYKVTSDVVNEFYDYYIFNPKEKQIYKPYENKDIIDSDGLKKSESPKVFEFPTKEIFEEFQTIRKELSELQTIKEELVELKNILRKKQELSNHISIPEPFDKHREYFQEEFSNIKSLVNTYKGEIEISLINFLKEQTKFEKPLLWFLVGVVVIVSLFFLVFEIFLIRNLFNH